MRTRLIRLGEFDAPVSMRLSPAPVLKRYQRWHPEREVDAAVYERLVARYGSEPVIRQYRGWRHGGARAREIPDFLIVDQPAAAGVVVVEVKARPTVYADVRQLASYTNLALDSFTGPVVAVLAAPAFSRSVPEWVTRWRLDIEAAA